MSKGVVRNCCVGVFEPSAAAPLQVAVPILLVLVALWVRQLSAAYPQQPPLTMSRATELGSKRAAYAASPTLRAEGAAALAGFVGAFPQAQALDSGATSVLHIPFFEPLEGTIDEYLLRSWWVLCGETCGPSLLIHASSQPAREHPWAILLPLWRAGVLSRCPMHSHSVCLRAAGMPQSATMTPCTSTPCQTLL